MTAETWTNPVYDGYLADPFVWRHHDRYYAVGTGAEREAHRSGRVLPLLRSRDLAHWEPLGGALERPDSVPGDEYWAPAVAEHDGRFYLYYSVGDAEIPRHELRVAVAERPEGPYRDRGALLPPGRLGFAIDPHPVRDDDGGWWLFYARDFLDDAGGSYPGTALAMDRLVGMTRLAGDERTVLRARHPWTLFEAARSLYGATWDWHTLEGPCVVRRGRQWFCFYSGSCWGRHSYGVDYAVADRLTGPWSDDGAERGPRVLATVPGRVLGPGHNSWIPAADGTEFLVYHAWDERGERRRMCIDRLEWGDDGPRCVPTWTPQPLPAPAVRR
jgi:GH43 family beta-xylosidase